MIITITDIIETLENPQGRFRTLRNVFPIAGPDGTPLINCGRGYADFSVEADGQTSVLRCFLSTAYPISTECFRLKDEPRWFTALKHLPCEMTVTDSNGNSHNLNVILQGAPDGIRLDMLLRESYLKSSFEKAGWLLREFAALASWLGEKGFIPGRILLSGTYFDCYGNLVMHDVNSILGTGLSTKALHDIAGICLLIYCMHRDPRFYAFIQAGRRYDPLEVAGRLEALCKGELPATINALIKVIEEEPELMSGYMHTFAETLHGLAECRDSFTALSRAIDTRWNVSDSDVRNRGIISQGCHTINRSINNNDIQELSKEGLFAEKYIWQGEFSAGVAVVETTQGFGLIDSHGNTVLKCIYDDIELDPDTGVAIVSAGGYSALCSPEGKMITPPYYERIMTSAEGLMVMQYEGRYGYMRPDGSIAIEARYDDANSFRNGFARVRRGERILLITPEGEIIDEIIPKGRFPRI